jgi:hypothetical protein
MEHAWAIFILLLEGLGIVAALTAVGMVVLHRINAALKLKAINDEYNQKQLQVARHNKHQLFIADQDAKFETIFKMDRHYLGEPNGNRCFLFLAPTCTYSTYSWRTYCRACMCYGFSITICRF